jgi:hypothetical protein
MKTKTFDTVSFFRDVKEKMAKKMEGMTFEQKRFFLQQVREGKISLT